MAGQGSIHTRPLEVSKLLLMAYTSKQGVTKRWHISWMTNSALVYEPKCGGEGGGGVAGGVHLYTGAQINFGDLTPYLTCTTKGKMFVCRK
jgi:hypothetical protein